MLEMEEAYRRLGVTDGATKDEIVKRYDILLKRHKISSQTGEKEEYTIEQINEAYNLLMGYENKAPEILVKPNPILRFICKSFKLDEKKTSNFFHYHKVHIVVGIIALIIVFTTVRGCINRVDPDFYLTFMGEIYVTDVEKVQNSVKEVLPDLVAPQVDPILLSDKDQGEQAYAMIMKATTLMAAGDMDLLILDKANFEKFGKQGAFIRMEDLIKELNVDKEKNKSFMLTPEETSEEGVYGIDVSESEFLKQQNIVGKEMIAAIKVNAKHHDKAIELLKAILK